MIEEKEKHLYSSKETSKDSHSRMVHTQGEIFFYIVLQ